MTTWADVALALAGAPVGAAIAVVGVHLTNSSNLAAQQAALDAERQRDSHAQRLKHRDETYQALITTANDLFASFKPVQDYGYPDKGLIDRLLSLEASLMLYAPAYIADLMDQYADRCTELIVVLHHGYPIAYTHRGNRDVREVTEQEAYEAAVSSYQQLIDAVRNELGLNTVFGKSS